MADREAQNPALAKLKEYMDEYAKAHGLHILCIAMEDKPDAKEVMLSLSEVNVSHTFGMNMAAILFQHDYCRTFIETYFSSKAVERIKEIVGHMVGAAEAETKTKN